jgi:integrase
MGRPKKIWRRKEDGHWYTTEGNRKVKVADGKLSYRDAWDEYKALHVDYDQTTITVKFLIDEYLEWCSINRSEGTYRWYRSFLKPFSETISDSLRVKDAQVFHVQRWLDKTGWADNTKSGGVKAVLRCFNWGVTQGLIKYNPFLGIERPPRTSREEVVDDAQFAKMVTLVEPEFADYLTFLYQTGARAQEVKLVTADHWDGEKLILERKNSKGKLHRRVIYANPTVAALINRLAAKFPKGPLFRNSNGDPWNTSTVRSKFRRIVKRKGKTKVYGLAEKMGIPGLCATTFRHSFCTNALKRGLDTTTVAQLMGHRDATMVARVYQHLAKDHEYMKAAAAKATSGGIVPLSLPAVPVGVPVPLA